MTIYPAGETVRKIVLNSPITRRTHVAVLDCPLDKTMDQALTELSDYIKSFDDYFTNPVATIDGTSITLRDGDVYTVAHETKYDDNHVPTHIPSNMLRHCYNTLFLSDIDFNSASADV